MSEPKFTPGPWVAINASGNCGYYVETGLTNETVCDLYFLGSTTRTRHDFENAEANAHLIAAAPDLYEALNALVSVSRLRSAIAEEDINPESPVGKGIAALAKARGEG